MHLTTAWPNGLIRDFMTCGRHAETLHGNGLGLVGGALLHIAALCLLIAGVGCGTETQSEGHDEQGRRIPTEHILNRIDQMGGDVESALVSFPFATIDENSRLVSLNLQKLDHHLGDRFGDLLGKLKNVDSLRSIRFSNFEVNSEDVSRLAEIPQLDSVAFSHTKGNWLNGLNQLGRLQSLSIWCRSSVSLAAVSELSNLRYLELRADNAYLSHLEALQNLERLETLLLTGNRFREMDAASVAMIAQIASLRRLEFGRIELTNESMTALGSMSKLRSLGFLNHVRDADAPLLELLSGCPHLEKLMLSNLSDPVVDSLQHLPKLWYLKTESGRGFEMPVSNLIALKRLPQLRLLDLDGSNEPDANERVRQWCQKHLPLVTISFRRSSLAE